MEFQDVSNFFLGLVAAAESNQDWITVDAHNSSRKSVREADRFCVRKDSMISVPYRENVTLQMVETFEEELEFYEIVSLVFLLYSNDITSTEMALQNLHIAYKSKHNDASSLLPLRLVSEWAKFQKSGQWQGKIIESLSVIQNYQILEKLGYRKEDISMRQREAYVEISHLRKALYTVCETLTVDKAERLIKLALEDCRRSGRTLRRHDPQYLEINILLWASERYLSLSDPVDISNLKKHLKVMEEEELVDILENALRRCERDAFPVRSIDHSTLTPAETKNTFLKRDDCGERPTDKPSLSHSVVSLCEAGPAPENKPYCYKIDPQNVGICLIINQKHFTREADPQLQEYLPETTLETRLGTDIDKDRLGEVFENLGFQVIIKENLIHTELQNVVQDVTQNKVKREHSCFVLCIMSHGRAGAVYGTNSIPVEIENIQKRFLGTNCPQLINKPKIVIIQACQGQELQSAVLCELAEDGAPGLCTVPNLSDLLVCLSTVEGYASMRHPLSGTWFIKTLHNEFLKHKEAVNVNDSLLDINNAVKQLRSPTSSLLIAMMPMFKVLLSKKLILPCRQKNRVSVSLKMIKRKLFEVLLDEFLTVNIRAALKINRMNTSVVR